MIKPTAAPKVANRRWLVITYGYAGLLIALILVQLLLLPQFIVFVANFVSDGKVNVGANGLAMGLIGAEVFSVPFLLRLQLSPLARLCSAVLLFITPLLWAAILMSGKSFSVGYLCIVAGVFLWSGISFWALGGPLVTHLNKKVT